MQLEKIMVYHRVLEFKSPQNSFFTVKEIILNQPLRVTRAIHVTEKKVLLRNLSRLIIGIAVTEPL